MSLGARLLSHVALVEADTSAGPGSTGTGEHTPTWATVAAAVPCVWQPMTEKLKRSVPGDIAICQAFFACNLDAVALEMGQRVTINGLRYRVEARHDAAGRGHHWEAGINRMGEDG